MKCHFRILLWTKTKSFSFFIYLLFLFCVNCSIGKSTKSNPNQFWILSIGFYANQIQSPTICNPEEASSPNGWSIARRWNEQTLAAIRVNIPMPTVHARNLFHSSAAMYDAWAAYDSKAKGWLFKNKYSNSTSLIKSSREMAMSFAAYKILTHRYKTNAPTTNNPAADLVAGNMAKEFRSQCYNPDFIIVGILRLEYNPHLPHKVFSDIYSDLRHEDLILNYNRPCDSPQTKRVKVEYQFVVQINKPTLNI